MKFSKFLIEKFENKNWIIFFWNFYCKIIKIMRIGIINEKTFWPIAPRLELKDFKRGWFLTFFGEQSWIFWCFPNDSLTGFSSRMHLFPVWTLGGKSFIASKLQLQSNRLSWKFSNCFCEIAPICKISIEFPYCKISKISAQSFRQKGKTGVWGLGRF